MTTNSIHEMLSTELTKLGVFDIICSFTYLLTCCFQVFMTTSSIHEMLSTELTKLGVFDIDKSKFTNWNEEKTHKTMLPGIFLN